MLNNIKSSNPVLNKNVFRVTNASTTTMTVKGTSSKTLFLLVLSIFSSIWVWQKFFNHENPYVISKYVLGGSIGGFITALAINIKKDWAPKLAPVYALLEGLVIGGVSSLLEYKYPGIAIQAASLTFATFSIMFFLYYTRIIAVTEKLKMGIAAALGGVCIVYLVSWLFSFFGHSFGFIYGNSNISIGFSIIVVGIAAFCLLLDFEMIKEGEVLGAPKYMEWYSAFALMVTLIWLYMEILRLLLKLRSRNDD